MVPGAACVQTGALVALGVFHWWLSVLFSSDWDPTQVHVLFGFSCFFMETERARGVTTS